MRAALIALLAAVPTLSQPMQVKLDTNATKVDFTLGDVLHTVHGIFKLRRGDISFDSATGKAGGELLVDAASGSSGNEARDGRMNRNVLQTNQYPEIIFTPDHIDGKVNLSGDSVFQLHGLFAIHGGSHELVMHVKSHIEGDRVTASTTFDVPYVKWGMKNPSTLILRVSQIVQIDIETVGLIKRDLR